MLEFALFCLTWFLHYYKLIRLHPVFNAYNLHARLSALVLILPIQVNCRKSSKIFLHQLFHLCTRIVSSNCDVFNPALTIQEYPRISMQCTFCLLFQPYETLLVDLPFGCSDPQSLAELESPESPMFDNTLSTQSTCTTTAFNRRNQNEQALFVLP